jgi:hypothetical protein
MATVVLELPPIVQPWFETDDDTPNAPEGEWRPAVQWTLPNPSPLDSAQSRRAAFQD